MYFCNHNVQIAAVYSSIYTALACWFLNLLNENMLLFLREVYSFFWWYFPQDLREGLALKMLLPTAAECCRTIAVGSKHPQSTASAESWDKYEETTSVSAAYESALSFPGCCEFLCSSWGPNLAVLQLLSQLHHFPLCWAGSSHGVETFSKGEKTCNLRVEEKLLWVAKLVHLKWQKLPYCHPWVFKDLTRQSLKWSRNPSRRKRVHFFLVTSCGTVLPHLWLKIASCHSSR